jgi:hypothetical protein
MTKQTRRDIGWYALMGFAVPSSGCAPMGGCGAVIYSMIV